MYILETIERVLDIYKKLNISDGLKIIWKWITKNHIYDVCLDYDNEYEHKLFVYFTIRNPSEKIDNAQFMVDDKCYNLHDEKRVKKENNIFYCRFKFENVLEDIVFNKAINTKSKFYLVITINQKKQKYKISGKNYNASQQAIKTDKDMSKESLTKFFSENSESFITKATSTK